MTLLMVKWYLSIFNLLLLTPVVCLLLSIFPPFAKATSSKTLFINFVFVSVIHFFFFRGTNEQIENECFKDFERESPAVHGPSLCLMNYTINNISFCKRKEEELVHFSRNIFSSRNIKRRKQFRGKTN